MKTKVFYFVAIMVGIDGRPARGQGLSFKAFVEVDFPVTHVVAVLIAFPAEGGGFRHRHGCAKRGLHLYAHGDGEAEADHILQRRCRDYRAYAFQLRRGRWRDSACDCAS